jgi:hypothetical protein
MRVHLIRSDELQIEKFEQILNLLHQFTGPLEFIPGEIAAQVVVETIQENQHILIHLAQPWDYFFNKCTAYREQHHLPSEDHVFLLTEEGNDRNWFGSIGPSNKDYFIQTSGWEQYFGTEVDNRFPIAYEVCIWLIRALMCDQREEILSIIHYEATGCGNDFCREKKDIILKMRTGDLCTECTAQLASRDLSPLILTQLFSIMDSIRSGLIFRNRIGIMHRPSRMEIRGLENRIFLTDLGDLELKLNPKEKTIYLFFLNHPEGVHLSYLTDYQDELLELYNRFTAQIDHHEIERSLQRLIDPLDNDINVVLSRIKRKLKDAVGEELLSFYHIDGPHGGIKCITLDREFVTFETND